MRARGMFLSLAISAVWLAATSSAGLRSRVRTGASLRRDATGDLDIFTVDPDGSGIVNVTGDPHHDARRIREERAARPAARLRRFHPRSADPTATFARRTSSSRCSRTPRRHHPRAAPEAVGRGARLPSWDYPARRARLAAATDVEEPL